LTYRIEFRAAARRDLQKLDPFVRRKVAADIEKLADNPRPKGSKKLEAEEKLYRVPAGPGKGFRVIYQIQDAILLVLVVKVRDRKEVYRRVT